MNAAFFVLAITDVGSGEDDTSTVQPIPLVWFILPSLFVFLLYTILSFAVWPHARPIVPIWLLLLFIFMPPFLPFLLFYLFIFSFILSPDSFYQRRHVIVVTDELVQGTQITVRK